MLLIVVLVMVSGLICCNYFNKIFAFELVNAHRLCFLKNMNNFNIKNFELFPFD